MDLYDFQKSCLKDLDTFRVDKKAVIRSQAS